MVEYWTPRQKISRRQYLERKMMLAGTNMLLAREATSSVAIEHPEWHMDEMRTWDQWEDERRKAER